MKENLGRYCGGTLDKCETQAPRETGGCNTVNDLTKRPEEDVVTVGSEPVSTVQDDTRYPTYKQGRF